LPKSKAKQAKQRSYFTKVQAKPLCPRNYVEKKLYIKYIIGNEIVLKISDVIHDTKIWGVAPIYAAQNFA